MAFTRPAGSTLHAALTDVAATQHHTATVAGDLNLNDLAEKSHDNLTGVSPTDHVSDTSQAAIEAETAASRHFDASLVRHSPGIAKVWVKWEQTGAHSILASYNMTSVTDGSAAGDTDHLYDDDFSSAEYAILGTGGNNAIVGRTVCPVDATQLAGGVTTLTEDVNNINVDFDENAMAIFGDQ